MSTETVSSSSEVGCKPEAPVDVTLSSRAIGSSSYRIELEGTPRGRVDSVDLVLVLPDHVSVTAGDRRRLFGATGQGVTRRLSADVRIDGPGAVVAASARVSLSGISPSKVTELILGTPPSPIRPATRALATPSGEVIDEEVRP